MEECPTTPLHELMNEAEIPSPTGPYDFSPSVDMGDVFTNNKATNNKYSDEVDEDEVTPSEPEVDDPESEAIAKADEERLEAHADSVLAEFDKKQALKQAALKKPAPKKRKEVESPEGIEKERKGAAKCGASREERYFAKGKVLEKPTDDFLKTGIMNGRVRGIKPCKNFWCDRRGCACGASAKW